MPIVIKSGPLKKTLVKTNLSVSLKFLAITKKYIDLKIGYIRKMPSG